MLKQILSLLGSAAFWIGWPIWFAHFKLQPRRSRVLIVSEGDVLLVRGWLGGKKWGLPGGGLKAGESVTAGSVREVEEEVGVRLAETALRQIGTYRHKAGGISYQAECCVVELSEKPALKIRWYEIADARWFKLSDIRGRMLGKDAGYALKQYLPLDQTRLF